MTTYKHEKPMHLPACVPCSPLTVGLSVNVPFHAEEATKAKTRMMRLTILQNKTVGCVEQYDCATKGNRPDKH